MDMKTTPLAALKDASLLKSDALIGGQWVAGNGRFDVYDPATGLHQNWWRDYDPAVQLGGIAYLFVRGMAGASTPVVDGMPTGVFTWLPPADLVTELSDLLAGAGGRS